MKIALGDLFFEFGRLHDQTGDQQAGQTPVAGRSRRSTACSCCCRPASRASSRSATQLHRRRRDAGLTFNAGRDSVRSTTRTARRRGVRRCRAPADGGARRCRRPDVPPRGAGIDITVTVFGRTRPLQGDFSIEQLRRHAPDGTQGARSARQRRGRRRSSTPLAGEVTLSNGQGAFVFSAGADQPTARPASPATLSGELRDGHADRAGRQRGDPGDQHDATGRSTRRSSSPARRSCRLPGNTFQLTSATSRVDFPPFLSLTGDFTFSSRHDGNADPTASSTAPRTSSSSSAPARTATATAGQPGRDRRAGHGRDRRRRQVRGANDDPATRPTTRSRSTPTARPSSSASRA